MSGTLVQRVPEQGDPSLGVAIATLREKVNLSARALSLKAKLSESYCGKLEKGEIEPSLRAFACIAHQLRLSPREVHVLVMREALRSQAEVES